MRLYRVEADACDYDQYDAFVVAAASEADAIALAVGPGCPAQRHWKGESPQVWSASPLPAYTEPTIVLGSFNAG